MKTYNKLKLNLKLRLRNNHPLFFLFILCYYFSLQGCNITGNKNHMKKDAQEDSKEGKKEEAPDIIMQEPESKDETLTPNPLSSSIFTGPPVTNLFASVALSPNLQGSKNKESPQRLTNQTTVYANTTNSSSVNSTYFPYTNIGTNIFGGADTTNTNNRVDNNLLGWLGTNTTNSKGSNIFGFSSTPTINNSEVNFFGSRVENVSCPYMKEGHDYCSKRNYKDAAKAYAHAAAIVGSKAYDDAKKIVDDVLDENNRVLFYTTHIKLLSEKKGDLPYASCIDYYVREGNNFLKSGKYREAAISYAKVVKIDNEKYTTVINILKGTHKAKFKYEEFPIDAKILFYDVLVQLTSDLIYSLDLYEFFDVDKKINCYVDVLKQDSKHYRSIRARVNKLHEEDRIKFYNRLTTPFCDNAEYYYDMGQAFLSISRNAEALECYKKAINIDPYSSEYYAIVGDLNCAQGNNQEAKKYYEKAIRLFAKNPSRYNSAELVNKIQGLIDKNILDAESQMELYTELIELQPTNANHFYGKGLIFAKLGKGKEAAKFYSKALSLNLYSKALSLNPSEMKANYIKISSELKDDQQKIYFYNKLINLTSTLNIHRSEDYQNKIVNKPLLGAFDQPLFGIYVEDSKKGNNNLNISIADYYHDRGVSYFVLGRKEDAIESYIEAISLDSKKYSSKSIAKSLTNERDKIEFYETLTKRFPYDKDYQYNLGLTLEKIGDNNRAIECYEKAIQLDDRNAIFYNQNGGAFLKLEKYENAIGAYKNATTIEPENALYHYNLGNAYFYANNVEGAINYYAHAVYLDSSKYEIINSAFPGDKERNIATTHGLRPDDQIALCDKLIELNSRDRYRKEAKAYAFYSKALILAGYPERSFESLVCYAQAVSLKPDKYNAETIVSWLSPESKILFYNELIALQPSIEKFYYDRGEVLYSLGRNEEALNSYVEAVNDRADTYLTSIIERLNKGDRTKFYEKLVNRYDTNSQFRYEQANFHYNDPDEVDTNKALSAYAKAIDLSSWRYREYKAEGIEKKLKLEHGVSFYKKLIDLRHDDPKYHYALGLIYNEIAKQESLWKGRYMQMLLHLNEDFDDDLLEESIDLLVDYGDKTAIAKSAAAESYARAIKLAPYSYEADKIVLSHFESYEDKIIFYTELLKLNSTNAKYHYGLGLALYARDRYYDAIEAYLKAVEYDSSNYGAKMIVNTLISNKEKIDFYTKLIKLYPNSAEYNYEKGLLLFNEINNTNLGEIINCYRAAINCCDREFDEKQKHKQLYIKNKCDILCALGDTYSLFKRDTEAIDEYNKAIDLKTNNDKIYSGKGQVLYRRSKGQVLDSRRKGYEESIKCYSEAIKLNPANKDYYIYIGNALYDLMEYEDAAEVYAKAVSLAPSQYDKIKSDINENLAKSDITKITFYEELVGFDHKNPAYFYDMVVAILTKYEGEEMPASWRNKVIKYYFKALAIDPTYKDKPLSGELSHTLDIILREEDKNVNF